MMLSRSCLACDLSCRPSTLRTSFLRAISTSFYAPKDAEEASEDVTYDSLKEIGRRTGNAAKEWMTGTSSKGSTIYKMARRSNRLEWPEMVKRFDAQHGEAHVDEDEELDKEPKAKSMQSKPFKEQDDIEKGIKTVSEKVKQVSGRRSYKEDGTKREGVLRPDAEHRASLQESHLDVNKRNDGY